MRQRASVVTMADWLRSDCNGIRCRFWFCKWAAMLVAKAEFPAPGDPLKHITLWPLAFLAASSAVGYSVSSGIFKGPWCWKCDLEANDDKRRWSRGLMRGVRQDTGHPDALSAGRMVVVRDQGVMWRAPERRGLFGRRRWFQYPCCYFGYFKCGYLMIMFCPHLSLWLYSPVDTSRNVTPGLGLPHLDAEYLKKRSCDRFHRCPRTKGLMRQIDIRSRPSHLLPFFPMPIYQFKISIMVDAIKRLLRSIPRLAVFSFFSWYWVHLD